MTTKCHFLLSTAMRWRMKPPTWLSVVRLGIKNGTRGEQSLSCTGAFMYHWPGFGDFSFLPNHRDMNPCFSSLPGVTAPAGGPGLTGVTGTVPVNTGVVAVDTGLWALDTGLWALDIGVWALESGFWGAAVFVKFRPLIGFGGGAEIQAKQSLDLV